MPIRGVHTMFYTSEPEAPLKRRMAARLLSLLPIEGLL